MSESVQPPPTRPKFRLPHWAILICLSLSIALFGWTTAYLSGWPSPNCFDCVTYESLPAIIVVSSACGRSDVREEWAKHIAAQPAASSLAYIFVVLFEDGKACYDEVERDIARGLPMTAPIQVGGGVRGDGISGLLPMDAITLWRAARRFAETAARDSKVALVGSTSCPWWIRTRDDVAIDAPALAATLHSITSHRLQAVLLGDFISSRCQHLFVPDGSVWSPLRDHNGELTRGGPAHVTLHSALYILSAVAVRNIAALESVGQLLARIADESSALPTLVLQTGTQNAAAIPVDARPLVLHGHLVASARQDLVWWSSTWKKPVGLATDSGQRLMEARTANPSRRIIAAGCGLSVANDGASGGHHTGYGDIEVKEAVAGIQDVLGALASTGSLLGKCCMLAEPQARAVSADSETIASQRTSSFVEHNVEL